MTDLPHDDVITIYLTVVVLFLVVAPIASLLLDWWRNMR